MRIILVAALFLLSSCGSVEYEPVYIREIRFASGWPYLPYEHLPGIMEEHGVIFTEILMEHSEIMPALAVSVAAGEPFADMVLLSGEMVFPAITNNLIYAIPEFVRGGSDARHTNDFLGYYWTFAPYEVDFDEVFLGVNLDIVNLEAGWDFVRFRELMELAVQAGYYGISGVPGDIIAHLIAANDGIMTYDFNYAYDDPRTIYALELSYDIFSTGLWQPDHGHHNWQGNFFAFLEGRAAFFPLSNWALQQVEIDFNYTTVPFPRGPDNAGAYSFMRGYTAGVAVPRWTDRPDEVHAVFEAIFRWVEGPAEAVQVQGKFDMGMAVPTFAWVNGMLAEGFYNGTMDVSGGVGRFRMAQQIILDEALRGW